MENLPELLEGALGSSRARIAAIREELKKEPNHRTVWHERCQELLGMLSRCVDKLEDCYKETVKPVPANAPASGSPTRGRKAKGAK